MKNPVRPVFENKFKLAGYVVLDILTENRSLLIVGVYFIPHFMKGTAWPISLIAPNILNNDMSDAKSFERGMDFLWRLATVNGIHLQSPLPVLLTMSWMRACGNVKQQGIKSQGQCST